MFQELENLLLNFKDKEVIVTNTYEENSVGYNLAHFVRKVAKVTYCIDARYKMQKEPEGYRVIEEGKVVLIKGDLYRDAEKVSSIIDKLGGNVNHIINIL